MAAVTLARLSDVANAVLAAHGARVKRAADLSVGNNTYTVIAFTAEDYDTDSIHDNSTNNSRLTIPSITGVTTGLWSVIAHGYTNATSGRADASIRLNAAGNPASGTALGFSSANGTSIPSFVVATHAVLTAGDYVELFVRTSGGSFSAIFEAGFSPVFAIAFLGKVT